MTVDSLYNNSRAFIKKNNTLVPVRVMRKDSNDLDDVNIAFTSPIPAPEQFTITFRAYPVSSSYGHRQTAKLYYFDGEEMKYKGVDSSSTARESSYTYDFESNSDTYGMDVYGYVGYSSNVKTSTIPVKVDYYNAWGIIVNNTSVSSTDPANPTIVNVSTKNINLTCSWSQSSSEQTHTTYYFKLVYNESND